VQVERLAGDMNAINSGTIAANGTEVTANTTRKGTMAQGRFLQAEAERTRTGHPDTLRPA
jgi:hypothetical protein